MNKIIIQQKDFDLNAEVIRTRANNSNIGAVVSFVGFVRDGQNQIIKKMTLEHYPVMSEKALNEIVQQAKERWDLGDITLIHRIGELPIDAQIVLVITTSKHRKSAFESCEFIIDYLKTEAPFWKKEHTESNVKWVEAKAYDSRRKARWSE